MTICFCTPVRNVSKVPDRRTFDFVVVDRFTDPTCGKACVLPNGRVEVLRSVWNRLRTPERDALLAHEAAHKFCGVVCEPCADKTAGAIMRRWGYTLGAVRTSFSWIQTRPAAGERAALGYGSLSADALGSALVERTPLPTPTMATRDGAGTSDQLGTALRDRPSVQQARTSAIEAAKAISVAQREAAKGGGGAGGSAAPEAGASGGFPWGLVLAAAAVVGGAYIVLKQ
jgi:hypothetical protein